MSLTVLAIVAGIEIALFLLASTRSLATGRAGNHSWS